MAATEYPSDDEKLTEALTEAVRRLEDDGEAGLQDYLDHNPALAPAIRERVDLLRRGGMLGAVEQSDSGVPDHLGEFVLGERLGGGGMGVVYAAHQASLGRRVALKLIRPEHLFFPGARERFRREIETIAKLEHSGIVRVFEAGEESGVPFYAMERVEGVSLAELLDVVRDQSPAALDERAARRAVAELCGHHGTLTTRGRGRRWSELCCRWLCDLAMAVEHAHQHGVLHRDIKPSNVMVTPDLSVKLLDFGLASTREASRITHSGSALGSLPYMAPEQFSGQSELVDERTDVYALGVTMYELLTLRSPFLHTGDDTERTRRRIVAGEAQSVRALNSATPWDIETVCAVAMDPDPHRRYTSAAELARDLQAALDLRPIRARRAGPVHRFRRAARRHPGWAVGASLGALVLVVGPSVFAIREGVANRRVATELAIKDSILEFLNDDLLAAVAPDRAGRAVSMREVLDRAAATVEKRFADRPDVEAAIRQTIGHTYRSLGALPEAERHLLRAVELFTEQRGPEHRMTLDARQDLGGLYRLQNRLPEAEALAREIVPLLARTLGAEHDDSLDAKNLLGLVLAQSARHEEAELILRDLVETRLRVSGEDDRKTLTAMANLGLLYYTSGRPQLAEPWCERDLAGSRRVFGEDHPDLLVSLNNWANVQGALGRVEAARPIREELVERAARVYGPRHVEMMRCVLSLARFLVSAGDYPAAERRLEEVLATAAELPPEHDVVLDAQETLAALQARTNRMDAALATLDAIEATCRSVTPPPDGRLRTTGRLRIACLCKAERWGEAAAQSEALIASADRENMRGVDLAEIHMGHGTCLRHLGRRAEAEVALLEADGLWREHAPRHKYVILTHRELIRLYEDWGKTTEAAAWKETARKWQQSADSSGS